MLFSRRTPHPNAFSRSIAATSSGLCIASLRGNSPRGVCTVSSILRPSPQRGGPVLNVAKCPILHAVMKARDIGLEGFNAPADLNALHVWQLAGRKATIRLKRDREFADSPVEEAGFELVWGFSCQVVVLGFC